MGKKRIDTTDAASKESRRLTLEDLTFIGSGRSKPSDPRPLSERHDEALADDLLSPPCRKHGDKA